jgi:transcriptional regulator with XRE-family HTH domain
VGNKKKIIGFGKNVRVERKKQGMSTQTLAEACGVSRSYLTLIENDMRLPGKKVLPKIAAALKLKKADVLNWYLEDLREKLK